jgi:hypothetical protein
MLHKSSSFANHICHKMLLSAGPAQQTAAAGCRHGADATNLSILSYNTKSTAQAVSPSLITHWRARAVSVWVTQPADRHNCNVLLPYCNYDLLNSDVALSLFIKCNHSVVETLYMHFPKARLLLVGIMFTVSYRWQSSGQILRCY